MRVFSVLSVLSCAGGNEIIGWNGQELNWNGKKLHRHGSKQKKLHAHPTFHKLVNARKHLFQTPALDTMKSIADHMWADSTKHPVLGELVHVAQDLVNSEDEEVAEATIDTFYDSLMRLTQDAKVNRDPDIATQIKDMRAKMCGGNPDLHREDCQEFMEKYCSTREDNEACSKFFSDSPDEEKPKAAKKPATKEPKPMYEESMTIGRPHQQENVPVLPDQGFEGDMTKHLDGETQTDDWRMEFGPGQADTYEGVCQRHPENKWCKQNGYGSFGHSGAATIGVSVLAAGLMGAALL